MSIVVLTGAGISAESGLATFRGPGGLWEGYRVKDVCTPEALARDPTLVHRFYDERRAGLASVEPNAAHHALVRLEQAGEVTLVTQNVDDLHARAGSRPIAMHGQLRSALCSVCGEHHRWNGALPPGSECPACERPALRPDIVFFGEMPRRMEEIEAALVACDLFVSIGTSGSVHPAAGFGRLASAGGARTLELNLEPTEVTGAFDEHRAGPATKRVPQWVDEVLEEWGRA